MRGASKRSREIFASSSAAIGCWCAAAASGGKLKLGLPQRAATASSGYLSRWAALARGGAYGLAFAAKIIALAACKDTRKLCKLCIAGK